MIDKLEQIKKRFEDVSEMLIQPDVVSDMKRYAQLNKEFKDLNKVVVEYEKYKIILSNKASAKVVLKTEKDPEFREMAKMELEELEPQEEEMEEILKQLLIPKDPNDDKNVIIELRAGTGGDEACIFVEDIYRMYTMYFKNKGWTVDKIMMNWSSPELNEWAKINPGAPPNPDPGLGKPFKFFKPIELKSGHTLNNFSELVLHFKKQIQFKLAHSVLDMVNEVNFQYRKDAKFNVSGIRENIQLFTDTGKVKQIYNALIKMSIAHFKEVENEDMPVFYLSFEEVKNKIIFSIHNINSQFGKSVHNIESRYGQDFTNLIDKQINGVCDFSLTADFNGEYADISIWPQKKAKIIPDFKGVQFNLIFYRA